MRNAGDFLSWRRKLLEVRRVIYPQTERERETARKKEKRVETLSKVKDRHKLEGPRPKAKAESLRENISYHFTYSHANIHSITALSESLRWFHNSTTRAMRHRKSLCNKNSLKVDRKAIQKGKRLRSGIERNSQRTRRIFAVH